MTRRIVGVACVALGLGVAPAFGQHPPGQQGSANIRIATHIPMEAASDIKIEQELSRPYAYVSTSRTGGFDIISVRDPSRATTIYSWRIENPELHQGGATGGMYFKIKGRYYYVQSVQFRGTGPDADLGAIVFDVTGLPDTSKVKETARIRVPGKPGGFHESYAYKHSDGRALFITTVVAPYAHIYDLERVIGGDPTRGVVSQVPLPGNPYAGAGANELTQLLMAALPGYHDFYVGYDPATHQDKLYGAGAGGYYLWDITKPEQPKLITSITGVAGVPFGHTFTPDPTGRYAVTETEYQYAPLRIFDLKPGLDGTAQTISRPIGAWTANGKNLAHNHEVRWPYVFVSAYKDGMYVFNMMDPTNPYTVGYYDAFDAPDDLGGQNAGVLGSMGGTFGVDVRNTDGLIVTSGRTGFWSFYLDGFSGWNGHQWGMPNISSAQDWDNGPAGAPKVQKVS